MLNKEKLLELYIPYDSILGPYTRKKDNRKHIILNNSKLPNGTKNKTKTISYPKAILESNIGRKLLKNETVDHRDRNILNDNIENLLIIDRSIHASLDVTRVNVDAVYCPECNSLFIPTVNQRNLKNRAGPFCSKRCSGIYGAKIQNNIQNKISRTEIIKTYYKLVK
jgi:hypothetical protein